MLRQIIKQKLKVFYEAKRAGNFSSSALAFFSIINILNTIKGKKTDIKINRNWELLHGELFQYTLEQIPSDIGKEEFNKAFKEAYESNAKVKRCKENIMKIIYNYQPLLTSYLNKKPSKEPIDVKNLKGDLGTHSLDI